MQPVDLSGVWPVRTDRLLLRPLVPGDVQDLLVYRSIPEVCRYVPFQPMTATDIATRIDGVWADAGHGCGVAITLRESGRVVGDLAFMAAGDEHRCAELGWVVNPADGGRGYATEAARAMITVAFTRCGMHRVIARVDARNRPSLALCRRLGMREEAHLRENEWFKGEWTDEVDFALLQSEWEA